MVVMVAASQLSFYPWPLVSEIGLATSTPVSDHSGLPLTPCVSRSSHSLRTFKIPLMCCKEIGSFRNVLTHPDFKCIILPNG